MMEQAEEVAPEVVKDKDVDVKEEDVERKVHMASQSTVGHMASACILELSVWHQRKDISL